MGGLFLGSQTPTDNHYSHYHFSGLAKGHNEIVFNLLASSWGKIS